jgi:hypothetical protein
MADDPQRSNIIVNTVVLGMMLLGLVGVGLSTAHSGWALHYWIALVPLYALLSIAGAWVGSEGERWSMLARQALHWGGVAVAVALDFYLRRSVLPGTGLLGISELLLLALGTYLAGVYFDRRFMLVGGLLALAALVLAKIDEHIWIVFAVAAVLAGLLFAVQRFPASSREP